MSLPKEIISVGLKMENYLPFNFPIRSAFQSEGTTEYSRKSNSQSLTANFEVSRYAKAWRGVHVCPSRVVKWRRQSSLEENGFNYEARRLGGG